MNDPLGRQLLIGILAARNDFITRSQLPEFVRLLPADKGLDAANRLESAGVSGAEARLLEDLADQHLAPFAQNPQQSIAALSSIDSLLEELRATGVESVLRFLPDHHDADGAVNSDSEVRNRSVPGGHREYNRPLDRARSRSMALPPRTFLLGVEQCDRENERSRDDLPLALWPQK